MPEKRGSPEKRASKAPKKRQRSPAKGSGKPRGRRASTESTAGESRLHVRQLRYCGSILLIVVVDQFSKLWARIALLPGYPRELLPVLDLRLQFNDGMAFSMLSGGAWWQLGLLILVAMGAILWFLRWLFSLPAEQRWHAYALVLLIGGATGNLIDRLVFSEVTDFISVHWGQVYFPTFNIADSAITLGVGLWLFLLMRHRARAKDE